MAPAAHGYVGGPCGPKLLSSLSALRCCAVMAATSEGYLSTKYTKFMSAKSPPPRMSVPGSRPWKPMSVQCSLGIAKLGTARLLLRCQPTHRRFQSSSWSSRCTGVDSKALSSSRTSSSCSVGALGARFRACRRPSRSATVPRGVFCIQTSSAARKKVRKSSARPRQSTSCSCMMAELRSGASATRGSSGEAAFDAVRRRCRKPVPLDMVSARLTVQNPVLDVRSGAKNCTESLCSHVKAA
eukprot:scaffold298_cov247-Pinguiococcus_pyrenoidosus.AAC.12